MFLSLCHLMMLVQVPRPAPLLVLAAGFSMVQITGTVACHSLCVLMSFQPSHTFSQWQS